ncbi:MAG: hypothetical protein HN691_13935 [Bacteroidetes bacterium]|nr:hypothetical protein [Bacteroidota bacterium]MBT4726882.1 hypothetical protein [Bacteroidota bacterium]MBT7995970.1 hypothetical protein [Bacteroidota bacterium]
MTQIANEYGVHLNTIIRWVEPIREELKMNGRRLLLPWQTKLIYEFLGLPEIEDSKE